MNKPIIPNGYVLLPRVEHPIDNMPSLYRDVWIYILKKARHKEDKVKGFKRGECLISIPELQDELTHYVGYKKVSPTKHQIDNVIRWLRKTNTYDALYDNGYDTNTKMITTTRTTRGMIVKVGGYAVFQDPKNYEYDSGYDNVNDTNTKRVRQQPDTIHKNVKNEKNEIKNNSATNVANEREEQLLKEFNDWWSLYNKKKDKKVALSKFKIARKQHSLETIVKGTKSYLKTVTNKQYQKHPKTFLNNETFLDEFDEHEITQTNKTDSHSSFDVTDYLADME